MKTAVIISWLAGVTLILAGLVWPAALAVPAAGTARVLAWVRWGAGLWAGLKVAVQLKVKLRQAAKTAGGSLERA